MTVSCLLLRNHYKDASNVVPQSNTAVVRLSFRQYCGYHSPGTSRIGAIHCPLNFKTYHRVSSNRTTTVKLFVTASNRLKIAVRIKRQREIWLGGSICGPCICCGTLLERMGSVRRNCWRADAVGLVTDSKWYKGGIRL
jgi:hypothetical protein